MDSVLYVVAGAAATAVFLVFAVAVPEIISRHMVQARIKRATDTLDSVTKAMGDFQNALDHMTVSVHDFARALDETGLTRLTVEHREREIEVGSTGPGRERST